jgi:hypothetical protein
LRPDGRIDVALIAHRGINWGQKQIRPPQLLDPFGNQGQKNFTVMPGEAIKIVLPPINVNPPVEFRKDPTTGSMRAVPRGAQASKRDAAHEMSITVQARVR